MKKVKSTMTIGKKVVSSLFIDVVNYKKIEDLIFDNNLIVVANFMKTMAKNPTEVYCLNL